MTQDPKIGAAARAFAMAALARAEDWDGLVLAIESAAHGMDDAPLERLLEPIVAAIAAYEEVEWGAPGPRGRRDLRRLRG